MKKLIFAKPFNASMGGVFLKRSVKIWEINHKIDRKIKNLKLDVFFLIPPLRNTKIDTGKSNNSVKLNVPKNFISMQITNPKKNMNIFPASKALDLYVME